MGEVIDGEPEEEILVDEEDNEEGEDEEIHLERAVLALDLADHRDSSESEKGVEQFEVVLPQPRKERRRWQKATVI